MDHNGHETLKVDWIYVGLVWIGGEVMIFSYD